MSAADLVEIVHLAIALFVAGLLLLVPVGGALGWRWVRNRPLRMIHLAAMGWIAAETVLGLACPLTVWEAALRGVTVERGFIQALVDRMLYYDLPAWIFGVAYVAGALLSAALWAAVPPRPRAPK